MELSLQRRKVVVMASSICCLAAFGNVMLPHFKEKAHFSSIVIGFILLLAFLLAFTMKEFTKLKRNEHE